MSQRIHTYTYVLAKGITKSRRSTTSDTGVSWNLRNGLASEVSTTSAPSAGGVQPPMRALLGTSETGLPARSRRNHNQEPAGHNLRYRRFWDLQSSGKRALGRGTTSNGIWGATSGDRTYNIIFLLAVQVLTFALCAETTSTPQRNIIGPQMAL